MAPRHVRPIPALLASFSEAVTMNGAEVMCGDVSHVRYWILLYISTDVLDITIYSSIVMCGERSEG